MQQMPSQVRATLAGSPVKDLRALAREADKVLNSSRMPGPAVRVVGDADVLAIREDVIAATQRQRPTAGLCYYHARFGTRAKQCRPPCSFASGNGRADAH
ncbi:hypothetical protein AAFF_G00172740 [Aldrovandia affinis]|uniref:Uncharacterized protein n=1 Tax=Aldrovandia affinis TaxID=143900 RepID=A0AAD7WW83_9TELE|nr:hypothetical protein AAFF_G00172740 [Aldrovandia affinis]